MSFPLTKSSFIVFCSPSALLLVQSIASLLSIWHHQAIQSTIAAHQRSLMFSSQLLQVKVQTTPGYAKGLTDGLPKFVQQNGAAG